MKHFRTYAGIAVHESGKRGLSIEPMKDGSGVRLLLHNGCPRGNMLATMTNEVAIEIAIELIKAARR